MAKSYYKAKWIGKLPMCAICGGAGEGPRAELFLTHGVSVWLCAAHRSEEFQRRRAGRDFVASVGAVWRAAGIRSKRHSRALTAHLRRIGPAAGRARPGSYSWPRLRQEAEARFAAGEDPRVVITALREAHLGLPARPPSIRTMRRWFAEGRWLRLGARRAGRPAGASPSRGSRPGPRPSTRPAGEASGEGIHGSWRRPPPGGSRPGRAT